MDPDILEKYPFWKKYRSKDFRKNSSVMRFMYHKLLRRFSSIGQIDQNNHNNNNQQLFNISEKTVKDILRRTIENEMGANKNNNWSSNGQNLLSNPSGGTVFNSGNLVTNFASPLDKKFYKRTNPTNQFVQENTGSASPTTLLNSPDDTKPGKSSPYNSSLKGYAKSTSYKNELSYEESPPYLSFNNGLPYVSSRPYTAAKNKDSIGTSPRSSRDSNSGRPSYNSSFSRPSGSLKRNSRSYSIRHSSVNDSVYNHPSTYNRQSSYNKVSSYDHPSRFSQSYNSTFRQSTMNNSSYDSRQFPEKHVSMQSGKSNSDQYTNLGRSTSANTGEKSVYLAEPSVYAGSYDAQADTTNMATTGYDGNLAGTSNYFPDATGPTNRSWTLDPYLKPEGNMNSKDSVDNGYSGMYGQGDTGYPYTYDEYRDDYSYSSYDSDGTATLIENSLEDRLEMLGSELTLDDLALIIQKNWKRYIARRDFLLIKAAVLLLQRAFRSCLAKQKIRNLLKKGIVVAQRADDVMTKMYQSLIIVEPRIATDCTIIVGKGVRTKTVSCHQVILAAHSELFAVLFDEFHTNEFVDGKPYTQLNHNIELDIRGEIDASDWDFIELYMYGFQLFARHSFWNLARLIAVTNNFKMCSLNEKLLKIYEKVKMNYVFRLIVAGHCNDSLVYLEQVTSEERPFLNSEFDDAKNFVLNRLKNNAPSSENEADVCEMILKWLSYQETCEKDRWETYALCLLQIPNYTLIKDTTKLSSYLSTMTKKASKNLQSSKIYKDIVFDILSAYWNAHYAELKVNTGIVVTTTGNLRWERASSLDTSLCYDWLAPGKVKFRSKRKSSTTPARKSLLCKNSTSLPFTCSD
ncbi:hypothetical protein SNEBB_001774 [Seison nebaliae]|nr:hypothetical protein SNEBB_001774 [Seison nebaliae]